MNRSRELNLATLKIRRKGKVVRGISFIKLAASEF